MCENIFFSFDALLLGFHILFNISEGVLSRSSAMSLSFSVGAIKTKQVVLIDLIIDFYMSLVFKEILIAPCKLSLLITFVQQVLRDRWSLVKWSGL